MSIYETVKTISVHTKTKDNLKFKPDFVVAVFYTDNNKEIQLFFNEYSRDVLYRNTCKYINFSVKYEFWDSSFCEKENFFQDDIELLRTNIVNKHNMDERRLVAGYIMGLYKVYNCILHSYISSDFSQYLSDIKLDKNSFIYFLSKISIKLTFNDLIMDIIKKTITDDNIVQFMSSNENNFKMNNFKRLVKGTRRVDEISKLIMARYKPPYIALMYHLELIHGCSDIISPERIVKYNHDNIFLNILHQDLDMEIYENTLLDVIEKYIYKGGNINIVYKFTDENAKMKQDFIIGHYKSYPSYTL